MCALSPSSQGREQVDEPPVVTLDQHACVIVGGIAMLFRVWVAIVVWTMTTLALDVTASAQGSIKYPDWKGAWARFAIRGLGGQPSFDQTKPWGRGQQAPLTPEYQAIFEASLADQAEGGQGNFIDHSARCLPAGMPLSMVAFFPLEFIITPDTTYVVITGADHLRRIFTDGRDWPEGIEPSYQGYSIGKWLDEDGDGIYDVLEVETRGPFKGPRAYDATGLPLHFDNQSVFKERIYRDKVDPKILHDQITVLDHALTRPWVVDKKYVHDPNPLRRWWENNCMETNNLVAVGKEMYAISADGYLMPVKKDQAPPDTRYFRKYDR